MEKLRIKWREFWRLEALELVGGKYLSWVRVLTKRKKGVRKCEVRSGKNARAFGCWVLECWSAGVLECWSWN